MIEKVNLELLFQIIPNILKVPFVINIDLLNASLKYISDTDVFILFLKSIAIDMAYYKHIPSYSIDLIKVCLYLKPNQLNLIHQLYQFSCMAEDHDQMLGAAEAFLSQAETPDLKAFGYYKVIQALMSNGSWLNAQEILPVYITSLQKMVVSPPQSIDPLVQQFGLQGIINPLLYLQDNPLLFRQLRNQISTLFQYFVPNWVSWSRNITNIDRNYPRILKIGYIAHTLKRHSVGWLSRWLIHYHDREQFKIYIYLINQQEDDITKIWFREKVDFIYNFPSITQEIADQIQQDQIDILVDLDSFSHGVTCQILALKPAPIQLTWLGSDATGLPAVDYFIADPYVLPDNAQEYYQENIWRLPQTYLAIDGFEVGVPTLNRENLNIPDDAIIYLNVQGDRKYHPDNIRLQMQIIQAVPNSYLLFKGRGKNSVVEKLLQYLAEEYNVSFDRLRFLETAPSEEIHRANLGIADVVLDTYPYNGATTTLETLWMGIPLVTRVGQQFSARNSYAFMINAGLTEGIAYTDEEYIDWGIRLGTDAQLRQQIHWKLQQSRKIAPLWNAKKFTQEMEKAYQQMWLKYLNTHLA